LIIKFRDLDKINGTYFESLAVQAGTENTIHTSFLQHGSRTGRISSKEPNLMNQPTRHDEWDVRYAFMAREGYTLIMADYSQMELRVVAHFSQDPIMLETFNNNGDIHAETMKATGATRLQSKAINFGLIYGLGPRTLAKNLDISEDTAKKYIHRFFTKYSTLRWFIDQTQQKALKIGYVSMITGRRRRFAEYQDNRWYNSIARMAINTKIQGSAADVIKVAMIRLQPLLTKLGAHQLIQVHDELIIECPDDKLEEVQEVIKDTMTHALKLKVPLAVGMSTNKRWMKG
jgi:DNA polymerase-1